MFLQIFNSLIFSLALCQNFELHPASLVAVKKCTKLMNGFFFGFDLLGPLIFDVIAFTPASPAYTIIHALGNFEQDWKLLCNCVHLLNRMKFATLQLHAYKSDPIYSWFVTFLHCYL